MNTEYDDIINLPHHVSRIHKPMSQHDRAAQFAPFAALSGYSDQIDDARRRTLALADLPTDSPLYMECIAV